MQTSTSTTSLDYNTSKATTSNTSSINAGVNSPSTQALNTSTTSDTQTETMDLSNETSESKGILGSIGDGLASAGAAVANGFKSAADWAIGGLKDAGANLAEATSNFVSNVETVIKKAENLIDSNPVTDFVADVASTGAVITTSVASGLYKIEEIAADGLTWAGGKLVEGGSWLLGQAVGVFSDEAKDSIDNWRKNFSTSIKEEIARDKVGELNKLFYEGTEIGRWVNAHSAIKYDSEVAKKIQGTTQVAGEIAAATALTIATGGAAAPFIVGALVGAGKAAESTYQKGTDTTILQELGIAGSGALTGLTWVMNGKLGQGAINIAKDFAQKVIVEEGGLTAIKGIASQLVNKEFIFSKLKEGLSIKNAGKINLNGIMNYVQAAMGTSSSLVPYITGEEEFDATAALKIGGTYLKYLGLNVLEDLARDAVSGYQPSKIIEDTPEEIFGFGKKNKKLDYNQWQKKISKAKFTTTIDGITFTSETNEGLNSLVDYYNKIVTDGGVDGAYFLSVLKNKGLTITDIPNKVGARAYHWGGTVFFDQNTLSQKTIGTFYHECGHYLDYLSRDSEQAAFTGVINNIKNAIRYGQYDVNSSFNQFKQDYTNMIYSVTAQEPNIRASITQQLAQGVKNWDGFSEVNKARIIDNEVNKTLRSLIDQQLRNSGYGAVSDIFDAISGGHVYDDVKMIGHGIEYFKDDVKKYKEVLANFSDLYNNGNLDVLDAYFPPAVRTALTDSYEKLIDVNALKMRFLNLRSIQESLYSEGSFERGLLEYITNNNPNAITRTNGVRDFVTSVDPAAISKYLTLPDVRYSILNELGSIVDSNTSSGYFISCLENYVNGTAGLNVFTRSNNIRNYIQMLDKSQISGFLKMIKGYY